MYINTNITNSRNINLNNIPILCLIRQNKTENLAEEIKKHCKTEDLKALEKSGLVEHVKAKNKADNVYNTIRLSSKGLQLLEDISTPEILEEDLVLYNWLCDTYRSSEKEIGNAKKTKLYIALFRAQSNISRNSLAFLCRVFMDDEECFEWSKRLEYLFFKPASVYAVRFDLEQSKLYQYYLKKKSYFDREFKRIENE